MKKEKISFEDVLSACMIVFGFSVTIIFLIGVAVNIAPEIL